MSLLSGADVARYLRVAPEEVARMAAEDGLPCLVLPGPTRPTRKYSPRALSQWLASRGQGVDAETLMEEMMTPASSTDTPPDSRTKAQSH